MAKELYGQSCEVTGYSNNNTHKSKDRSTAAAVVSPRLVIYDGTGGRGESSIAVNVDLSRCEAIAANADYPTPAEYILTIRLLQPPRQEQPQQHQPTPKHHRTRDSKEYSRTAKEGEDAMKDLLGVLSPFDLRLEVPIENDNDNNYHADDDADADGASEGVGSKEAPTLPVDAVLMRSSGVMAAAVGGGPALVVPLAREDLCREDGLPELSVVVVV